MNSKKPRIIRPEEEDRRTDHPAPADAQVKRSPPRRRDQRAAQEADVESLPDGEEDAQREAALSRDD
jgi:hypothetical protein